MFSKSLESTNKFENQECGVFSCYLTMILALTLPMTLKVKSLFSYAMLYFWHRVRAEDFTLDISLNFRKFGFDWSCAWSNEINAVFRKFAIWLVPCYLIIPSSLRSFEGQAVWLLMFTFHFQIVSSLIYVFLSMTVQGHLTVKSSDYSIFSSFQFFFKSFDTEHLSRSCQGQVIWPVNVYFILCLFNHFTLTESHLEHDIPMLLEGYLLFFTF